MNFTAHAILIFKFNCGARGQPVRVGDLGPNPIHPLVVTLSCLIYLNYYQKEPKIKDNLLPGHNNVFYIQYMFYIRRDTSQVLKP